MSLQNNDKRFDIDLAYGQVFESKVADMLQSKKIEVKTERGMWQRTRNIAVEFESRGKPSGIATTEADYWFHNLAKDNEVICTLVFPVSVLRSYIESAQPRIVKGGDDMTSKLYLINLSELMKQI